MSEVGINAFVNCFQPALVKICDTQWRYFTEFLSGDITVKELISHLLSPQWPNGWDARSFALSLMHNLEDEDLFLICKPVFSALNSVYGFSHVFSSSRDIHKGYGTRTESSSNNINSSPASSRFCFSFYNTRNIKVPHVGFCVNLKNQTRDSKDWLSNEKYRAWVGQWTNLLFFKFFLEIVKPSIEPSELVDLLLIFVRDVHLSVLQNTIDWTPSKQNPSQSRPKQRTLGEESLFCFESVLRRSSSKILRWPGG